MRGGSKRGGWMRVRALRTRPARDCSGQMAVELACLMPVVLVMAIVAFNLVRFVEACALFDRVALDAVVMQGVAPDGEQSLVSSVSAVRASVEEAFSDMSSCEVAVRAVPLSTGADAGLAVNPLLTRFVCTLRFHPWPLAFSVAGIEARVPLALTHEKSIVIDRFRPGVVI